jgi:CMP/dCMP kinase
MIITIDGPTASGKTSIARLLATKLDYYYLNSGILFRGLAYVLAYYKKYDQDQLLHAQLPAIQEIIDRGSFMYAYDTINQEQVYFNGINITPHMRDAHISNYASIIAVNLNVRSALARMQHAIAQNRNLVAEGRDMGSIIFPNAAVKFFLTASVEVRAQRWLADQRAKDRLLSLEQAAIEVQTRDERDANRTVAPLIIPQGALVIDSSTLSKEEVVARMQQEITKHLV